MFDVTHHQPPTRQPTLPTMYVTVPWYNPLDLYYIFSSSFGPTTYLYQF